MSKNIIVCMLSLLLFVNCKEKKPSEKAEEQTIQSSPNIVFILADDLGFADLGYAGSDLYQTPNIDKLASKSMYFTKAHSSHPTCQPSRISLITGKTPSRLGAVSHGSLGGVTGAGIEMKSDEITYGNVLQKAGYTTAHIGKWHIGSGDNGPKDRGFDVEIASNEFCCPGSYNYPYISRVLNAEKTKKSAVPDLESYSPETHLTEALSAEAARFIENQKGAKKPFFLNLWYYAVHTPMEANKDKVEKYKKLITPENKHTHATYAALVEHLDDGVGTIIKALEDNGMADNTIIIFMGDNGGELKSGITKNYPLRGGKGMFYEGGTRVPMFVYWPGVVKPGTVTNERVAGWDIYPTLLTMAKVKEDVERNKNIDGVDLTPLLKDPNVKFENRQFNWIKYVSLIHYANKKERNWPGRSIIKDDWKLIEYFNMPYALDRHQYLLFNLDEDPSETKNLAKENPQKLEALKNAMDKWGEDVNAPKYEMEKFYGEVYRASLTK
ncbi:sulfatase [Flavivirga abyssicola]|uniref:sulfatase n=1 Tax=Flavivirga abyssicola TaxID=3063533 RepID=UPI0026E0E182|nr:sulfatase [Flavivirga sp. MEBiC07777]WVK11668.1 sulfatase [Flavivirga sp. MEBiC07777]